MLLLLILFSGCVKSSPIDLPEAKSIPTNEGVVFGRAKVIFNGKIRASFVEGINNPALILLILPDGSSEQIEYPFYHDGSFIWHLPPGGYTIVRFEAKPLGVYSRRLLGRIFAHFDVLEDKVTYIGTLTLEFRGAQYRKFVEDEYEVALEQFRKKFPEIEGDPRRSLMVVEKDR